ncbi:MAG: hypothetical protein ABIW76_23935, partial [Fibrobacteria bacterium]
MPTEHLNRKSSKISLALLLGALLSAGCIFAAGRLSAQTSAEPSAQGPATTSSAPSASGPSSNLSVTGSNPSDARRTAIVVATERAAPSVVSITVR